MLLTRGGAAPDHHHNDDAIVNRLVDVIGASRAGCAVASCIKVVTDAASETS